MRSGAETTHDSARNNTCSARASNNPASRTAQQGKDVGVMWSSMLLHFELQPGLRRDLDVRPRGHRHDSSSAGPRACSDSGALPATEYVAKDASSGCARADLDRRALAFAGAL